ncbi:MAG: multidrug ABC transporter permease [Rhodospirillaceae bacterium]|nr:multidrug ABC transporter permease [Rhodospirillaceae bacterium]
MTDTPATPSGAVFSVPLPRTIGRVNWRGLWELYMKEVRRFWKVIVQTVAAPVITSLMFLLVMVFAFGRANVMVGGYHFAEFLVPGLVIMTMIQNAFANTSSSILVAKVQGNIVDVLMPPLSALELTIAWIMGGATRGVIVGITCVAVMGLFVELHFHNIWLILFHGLAGSLFMSAMGVIGAIWADKFDHMAAVTNFVVTPLTFLSGTFYTIDRLPEWAQFIAHYNPFFYNIDGFRYGFLGQQPSQPLLGVVVLTALNLALFVLTYQMIKRGYKLKA